MAKAALFHPTVSTSSFLPGERRALGPAPPFQHSGRRRGSTMIAVTAQLGGDRGGAKKAEKKFITKEEEPDQYWQTPGEREGENPMKTPLPYIIIFGMSTPFVILALAFANGWIKVPVR